MQLIYNSFSSNLSTLFLTLSNNFSEKLCGSFTIYHKIIVNFYCWKEGSTIISWFWPLFLNNWNLFLYYIQPLFCFPWMSTYYYLIYECISTSSFLSSSSFSLSSSSIKSSIPRKNLIAPIETRGFYSIHHYFYTLLKQAVAIALTVLLSTHTYFYSFFTFFLYKVVRMFKASLPATWLLSSSILFKNDWIALLYYCLIYIFTFSFLFPLLVDTTSLTICP